MKSLQYFLCAVTVYSNHFLISALFFLYFFICFFFLTEPVAEVTKGLISSTAVAGEAFSLSVELSAVCSGFWSLDGRLLRSGADYLITRSKTAHTLLIRCVTAEMDGTVVKFAGGGSQSSCTLSVKGMSPPSKKKHNKKHKKRSLVSK